MTRILFSLLITPLFLSCGPSTAPFSVKPDYYALGRATSGISRAIYDQTGITWASTMHTASPVPLLVYGRTLKQPIPRYDSHHTVLNNYMNQALAENRPVVLLIGDGVGFNALRLLSLYASDPDGLHTILPKGQLSILDNVTSRGTMTDSAASGTAIAAGVRTRNGYTGMDDAGKPVVTILDRYHRKGYPTGLVTTARVTHATPAVFYAHVVDRDNEKDIARQYLESGKVNLLLGGGRRYFRNYEPVLREKGYSMVFTTSELRKRQPVKGPLLGLFAESHLKYAIDRNKTGETEPTLADMVKAGLSFIDRGKPFFLMAEAARIDHAAHANDLGTFMAELYHMELAIQEVVKYMETRSDILFIVTSDHETGGPAFTIDQDREFDLKTLVKTYMKQEKSLEYILEKSKSSGDFLKLMEKFTPYTIGRVKAEEIYSLYKGL